MDKTRKNLLKFSSNERDKVLSVIKMIEEGDLLGLDIKKILGTDLFFRVRVGKIRIVFRKHEKYNEIIYVGRRSEKTYKDF